VRGVGKLSQGHPIVRAAPIDYAVRADLAQRSQASAVKEGTMRGIKKTFILSALLCVAISDAPAEAPEKINICHLESNFLGYVIRISVKAWPAHEKHFDYVSPVLNVGDPCGIIE